MLRLWAIASILIAPLCAGQVTGSFSLDKTDFAHGEPVILSMTVTNKGEEPQELSVADPYSFCSGYEIKIYRPSECVASTELP